MDLSATLHAFHFLRPAWLLALPPLWGLAVRLASRRRRDGDWARLIDPELLPGLRLADSDGDGGRSPWPWLALAWSLAVLALAGPAWQPDPVPAYQAPAAWVLVLDLSPSMATADLAPNRATRARYGIEDLLDAAHDARVGLVVFSDEAYAVTPLTADVATVRTLLPPLAPEIMPTPGDLLAPALERAGQLLKTAGRGEVVVFSDGFADPAAAFAAGERLHARGITVDVVGVAGSPAGNAPGQPTRLDVDRLQRLAAVGGGRYVSLAGLPALIGDLRARPNRATGATAAAGIQVHHWRDAGVWLLPPLLLLAAWLGRRGRL